jgi:hypothetical protein
MIFPGADSGLRDKLMRLFPPLPPKDTFFIDINPVTDFETWQRIEYRPGPFVPKGDGARLVAHRYTEKDGKVHHKPVYRVKAGRREV